MWKRWTLRKWCVCENSSWNPTKAKRFRLTYLPFIIKAIVGGLKEYPLLNSSLDKEKEVIQLKHYYNIGIATDTPQGLIVPVVKQVDKKDIPSACTGNRPAFRSRFRR